MLAPDGAKLGFCDKKRADWYLDRGLAERLPDGNSIRLTFEPSGREGSELSLGRENKCVVCGSTESLTKHHVVPRCYRVWFPLHMKQHNSYDLHAMCLDCHSKYEAEAYLVRLSLAEKHKAPMDVSTVDILAMRARGAARTLLKYSQKIPAARREVLLGTVRAYLGKDDVGVDDLSDLSGLDVCFHWEGQKLHAQMVMESVVASGGEHEFIVMWRKHFVDRMAPRFLPTKWDVYNKEVSRQRKS
jgi:hypothetical protein